MMIFETSSPAESPKSVLTHEHVTCTLDAGGDAPQLTSMEIRLVARYARQPADAFEHPKPHTPGRDPVWAHGGYGLPQVDLIAPRTSWILALQEQKREESYKGEG